VVAETVGDRERVLGELCQGLQRHPGSVIIIIISVLFITLTCNLPEWCDKIKLSNLLLPRKGGPGGVVYPSFHL